MARYQMIFRTGAGDRIMLVDGDGPDSEPLAYLRQPLEMGAIVETNGKTWLVVGDSSHDGVRRFTCAPTRNDSSS